MGRRNQTRSELDQLSDFYGMSHELDKETGEWVIASRDGLSHAEAVEKYTERTNRLNAVAGVYQRANRIITGEEVTVTVINDPDMDTNARSNGKDMELNASLIEDLTDESIISLNGVNYHELGHILFSPRIGSNLGIYARDNKLFRALAILEEARTEQLLITRYPAVRKYLEASLYTYILAGKPSEWGGKFHLITGRTYLPIELRQAIAEKAVDQYGLDIVQEVHSIIHAYRGLVFPRDFDTAKALAHRLAKIVGLDEEQPPQGGITGIGGECGLPTKGRPAGTKEQEQLQKDSPKSPTERLGKGDSQESAPTTNKPAPSNQTAGESDREQDSEDTKLAGTLNKRMEQIKNDSSVKREIRDTRNAIIDSDVARSEIGKSRFHELTPSDTAISTAKRFGAELERLVRNNDPAWVSRVRSGRLNISRTMNPDVNAIAEAFDQWDIGNEATDIEAVILTDNSGSMGGLMKSVCENTWIIKRGIESINGSVTVYNFDSDSELLYEAGDRAKAREMRFVESGGNTNPIRGIIEADRILSASKKSIKILFIVTDGEWEKEAQCDDLIKRMGEKGVITSVVFLGDYKGYREVLGRSAMGDEQATQYIARLRHKARVFHAVSTTRDILNVATELVKSTLKKVA
jgi:hypothetical protein